MLKALRLKQQAEGESELKREKDAECEEKDEYIHHCVVRDLSSTTFQPTETLFYFKECVTSVGIWTEDRSYMLE